jgi:hypothetical protein
MSFVDRTIVLVDCKENVGSVVADLIFPINKLRKTAETITTTINIQKTALSYIVEGIAEYSRLLFDLFPDDTQVIQMQYNLVVNAHQVNVFTARDRVTRHNTWKPEEQTVNKVHKNLSFF